MSNIDGQSKSVIQWFEKYISYDVNKTSELSSFSDHYENFSKNELHIIPVSKRSFSTSLKGLLSKEIKKGSVVIHNKKRVSFEGIRYKDSCIGANSTSDQYTVS
jgi:hypothetical protein